MFTMGNIITLGIVLVALVAYRQLDRDNRSLERVKKYADKLREELAAYVDKRSEDLKHYGIELEVQQKAAKFALEKVQTVQTALSERAGAIDGIEKRLGEYDSALARLADMTARVDENLARLHDEAEFTESVARKLDAAEKGMREIQNELPAMRSGFARDAASALDSFKDEMLADVGRRLGEVGAILEKAKAEAAGSLSRAEAGKAEIDRELLKSFEKAKAQALKLEDIAFGKLKENTEAKAARLKETLEEKFAQLMTLAKERTSETQTMLKALKGEWKAAASEAKAELAAQMEESRASMESRLKEAESRVEAAAASAARTGADVSAAAGRASSEMAALDSKFKAEHKALAERLGAESAALAAGLGAENKNLSERLTAANKLLAERLDAENRQLSERLGAENRELAARLSSASAELSTKTFEELGQRLAEYRSESEARFERLEAVGAELVGLDKALRDRMDETARRVENEFGQFSQALDERRQDFEEGFTAEATRLRTGMKSVEAELDALKSRAYDNVSERLKVFEDEFFADLNARGQNIDARLDAWRGDIDRTLVDLSAKAASDRALVEKKLIEETRARVAETQARLTEQFDKIRQRAEDLQAGIEAQGGMAAESLAGLRDSVRRDSEEAQSRALSYVESELARFSAEAEARLKAAERELAARIAALDASIGSEEERVARSREELAEAARTFGSRFSESIDQAEKRLRGELEGFAAASAALVDKARDEYEAQHEGFASRAQSERDRITQELAALADRVAELRADMSSRIGQALEGFGRDYESLLVDLEKRKRELQAESDTQLREQREMVKDIALGINNARAQALGKVESEAARLSSILGDIDKQQKSFIAQTKIFDRADELKQNLADSIAAMKAEIAGLSGRKAELAEIEGQLGKVKRLEDEVNQKLGRFLAEKRRVDSLEQDFARLAATSQNVDRRMEEVTGQADALADIQATIQRLIELGKDAQARTERLEKKSNLLEATTEAVDRGFTQVRSLEKEVASLGQELRSIPASIEELREGIDKIADKRQAIQEATEKLGSLDGILSDTEKRIADMHKAREWLARAETRLEDIDRRAQEQLKLLSDLLKKEGRSKSEAPASVQDTVRKLARQGWKADEIASTVKISRGEVELMLEMGSKK